MRAFLRREWQAMALVLALAGALFAAIEWRMPYYFLWDDNAASYLSFYTYNYKALTTGQLALFNPHQYSGQSHLGAGQTAVLYPVLYPLLFLTQAFWQDLQPSIDVIAIFHLLTSALGMFCLLRSLKISRAAAIVVALQWVSFPFLTQLAKNWIVVSYIAAYAPWSFLLLLRLLEKPRDVSRILALAGVKALLILQGYVQYAILLAIYESLYIVISWLWHRVPWAQVFKEGISWTLALLTSGILAAPLLLPMFYAKEASATRSGRLDYNTIVDLALEFAPFLGAQIYDMFPHAVRGWATAAMYYIGLPNLLLAAILVEEKRRKPLIFLILALGAFFLCTEAYGIMYYVPVLWSFRWPFKSFVFVLFFLALAFAYAYDLYFKHSQRWARRFGAVLAFVALAGNATVLLIPAWNAPIMYIRIDQKIADLRAQAAALLPVDQGRFISVGEDVHWPEPQRFWNTNYATLIHAYHLVGYDNLISAKHVERNVHQYYEEVTDKEQLSRAALDSLSAWSVRFILAAENSEIHTSLQEFPTLQRLRQNNGIVVYENAEALPFASFVEGEEVRPVDLEWHATGIRLSTAGRGGRLRLTVVPSPFYVWSADGVEMGPVPSDEEQIFLDVPHGTRRVEIRYVNRPFRMGLGISLSFILVAGVAAFQRRRKAEDRP